MPHFPAGHVLGVVGDIVVVVLVVVVVIVVVAVVVVVVVVEPYYFYINIKDAVICPTRGLCVITRTQAIF